ncbi:MAG: adenylate kinase [Alphaproteobacteria bacterium]
MSLKHKKHPMHIILMGPPGGGKGTQARILQKETGAIHLSTGEMFRAAGKAGTELGLKAKALIDEGNLVPDDISIGLISEKLEEACCESGVILDGFPRTLPQAEALDRMFKEKKIKIDNVIDIQVPDEIIVERITGRFSCIKCGATYHDKFKKTKVYGMCDVCGATDFVRRIDDNRKTVKARLEQYRSLTFPVLPYYEKKGMLKCIDGTGAIETVAEKIRSVINFHEES